MGNAHSNNRPIQRVAVLGGGPSGLSAAYTLLRTNADVHVDVYEASDRFGGAITTETGGGFTFDLGPNAMVAKHEQIHRLIHDELKLGPRITPRDSSRRFLVMKGGQLKPVPLSPAQLIKSDLLNWRGKLRLCVEPFVRKRGRQGSIEGVEAESVGSFFSRRFGQQVTDYLVDPGVAGIYSSDPYKLSMKHAFKRVWHVEQMYGSVLTGLLRGGFKTNEGEPGAITAKKSKGGVRSKQNQSLTNANAQVSHKQLMQGFNYDDGMHVLTDTLVDRIKDFGPRAKLITDSAVHTLDSTTPSAYSSSSSSSSKNRPKKPFYLQAGQWRVNGHRRRYDAVITTIPAHALKGVTSNVRSVRRGFRKLSAQIPYAPVSVVVMGFDKAQMSPDVYGYGSLIPSKEAGSSNGLLGVNFTSEGFPSRLTDKSKTFWTVYMGGARNPDITNVDPKVVVDMAVGQLQQHFGVKGAPAFTRVMNWSKGFPLYHTKYDQALCTMARIERRTKGSVALAGNYRDGVGVPDALLSGVQHALRINQFLQTSR